MAYPWAFGSTLTSADLNAAIAAASGLKFISSNTVTASSSFSIDSCFSATYSAYVFEMELTAAAGAPGVAARMRLAGVDNSATEYDYSNIIDNPTTPASALTTAATSGGVCRVATTLSTCTLRVYRPAAAEPTAWKSTYQAGIASPVQGTYAGGHEVSAAYDGITFIPASSTISGIIRVYALAVA